MWDQESRTFAELLLRRRETEADAPALWTRSTVSTSMASSPSDGIGRWRTWGEIIDDVWRATDALARLGVGAGDRVVQFAENRYEWLVVDQAILALGAIHVPIHSTLGGRQAWQQIDHCGARVVLVSDSAQALKLATHEAERPRVSRSGADDDSRGDFQIVAYGPSETSATSPDSSLSEQRIAGRPISVWSELFAAADMAQGRERAVHFAARGDSATTASILYTSGTMGEPRGAVLTHANLLANLRGIMEAFRERTTELRLCFLPLSHIYARTADLNVWLVSGTQMALATSPETTVEDCQIVRPTFLNGVPYFFGRVAKRLAEAGVAQVPGVLRKTLGGRIELCSCGGAATPESLFDYFHSQGVGLLPGYGLTEASPVVTASTATLARRGCVGRPLPNVEVRLADDGEILTRGPHVMSGYYRDDAATAAALRDGWLQTGDLGRWEPDGLLRITGRKKELIVTAVGKNVAPSLLESLLTQDPFILQAAVVGEGRNYLGALIVPNRDALQEWATESLASSQASNAARGGDASPASLDWPQLLAHPAVIAEYARRIAQRLADLSPHEQIRRFHLAPRGFTIELDELTPKLSLRRHVIQSHFSTEIAALFDDSSASAPETSSSGDSSPKAEIPQESAPNFAETTLRMAGKSEEESRRTGNLDRADDQTEKLFQERYQTAQSPLHRAVWDDQVPLELFAPARASIRGDNENTDNPAAANAIERSLEIVRDAVRDGRLFGDDGKLSDDMVGRLATAGYWGLLVPREHGGAGATFQQFAAMLRRMATWSATAAGWGSVHGCIGAIDPLVTFGTANQRNALLPRLASGETLSAFALTEPWAGSDLTALRTRAERDGDGFRLYGEKLFITNAGPGRVIGLVALLDKQPAVFICELPRVESDEFRFRRYELHALKHSHNCGLVFNGLRIPAASLLESKQGNGLTIAYHGLNRGRVAVCATAAGQLRSLLAGMLAWGGKRVTYGQPIAKRELVMRRIGRMAALIVGCDALSDWCASLLDQGYRGELECIVAKVFGSEALKEGAIDLALKTHGGRAFVRGHVCGDNMHDYLAPTIYEGEGELLGLALFKGLVKQHATTYFEPLMKALRQSGLKAPPRWNPLHWWKLRSAAWPYAKWILSRRRPRGRQLPPSLASADPSAAAAGFNSLVEFATREFTATGLQIDRALRRHQLRLADRQCRMSELAKRVQRLTALLCVTMHGAAQTNEVARAAAIVLGNDLQRELTGRPISDAELRATVELGQAVLRDPSSLLADCPQASIVMPYDAG